MKLTHFFLIYAVFSIAIFSCKSPEAALNQKPQYTLSITLNPTDAGSISPTSGTFQEGSVVSITVTPKMDFNFLNWTGSYTASENPLNLKMMRNETLVANFRAKQDSDGDGIPDDRDAEPKTRKGAPIDATGKMENPLFLDKNGVTIKAKDWSIGGDIGTINGIEYRVASDESFFGSWVQGSSPPLVCTSKLTRIYNVTGLINQLFANRSAFIESIKTWDVSNVVNFSSAFLIQLPSDNTYAQSINLSYWDVSKAENMGSMFFKSNFNGDISMWDVSNVKIMNGMFLGASSFNKDISKWNVSNVKNMGAMFYEASSFNQDISNWNVSNVTDMGSMFSDASSFNKDISKWNVSNVTNMMQIFFRAKLFNQDISKWNVSKVVNMQIMFNGATSFNQDISKWNVSNVNIMAGMFSEASSFNQDISNWKVSNVTDMSSMFSNASSFNKDISKWNVSNVKSMSGMFSGASSFNQDISGWNVGKVTRMVSMFARASFFNQNLSKWNTINVINCGNFSLSTPKWILSKPVFANCAP